MKSSTLTDEFLKETPLRGPHTAMVSLDQVLDMLNSACFAKWYNEGNFDHYISGDLPKISEEDIKRELLFLLQK